nr:bifunctional methylenetetrahydrofolate dehydrogenase/methenyltetrahydrofolate cyclohydrolase [Candidatus Bathyarchaeota archaeon]
MGARVIDGRRIAAEIRKQLAEEAKLLWEEHGVRPGLAAILVGSDPASEVYLRIKRKACEEASFEFRKYSLPENVGEEDVIELLQKLNGESSIHGI